MEQKLINMNEVLSDFAGLLDVTRPKKVAQETMVEPHLPPIEGDPSQIEQILMNLVTNAYEAIGNREGRVRVSASSVEVCPENPVLLYGGKPLSAGRYVMMSVSDDGCGMDDATLGNIFEPFFTTKPTGRGLGLASALGIIRKHHGGVRVETVSGKGTVFHVYLPAISAPAPQAASADVGFMCVASGPKGAALVIDDDPMICDVMDRILTRAGMTVIKETSSPKGVEAYRLLAGKVRLVILDMTMPHLNGAQIFRAIRTIHPQVTVLLTSGFNEQEAGLLYQEGLAGFIHKPFTPAQLVEKVRSVLTPQSSTKIQTPKAA